MEDPWRTLQSLEKPAARTCITFGHSKYINAATRQTSWIKFITVKVNIPWVENPKWAQLSHSDMFLSIQQLLLHSAHSILVRNPIIIVQSQRELHPILTTRQLLTSARLVVAARFKGYCPSLLLGCKKSEQFNDDIYGVIAHRKWFLVNVRRLIFV